MACASRAQVACAGRKQVACASRTQEVMLDDPANDGYAWRRQVGQAAGELDATCSVNVRAIPTGHVQVYASVPVHESLFPPVCR